MKCLKIENCRGHYSIDGNAWKEIDKITKEELLQLLNTGLKEGFDMDDIDEKEVKNKAHEIIYRNLYGKFQELNSNRTRFEDESNILFKDAVEKYSIPKV